MDKSFYYVVTWSEAKTYKDALDENAIPYEIQTPLDLPSLDDGKLAIVFPTIPLRIYSKVRSLFFSDGLRYPS